MRSSARTPAASPEPETLEQLLGDCRRMAEHWQVPATTAPPAVSPARLHGITVPTASANLVNAMPEFAE